MILTLIVAISELLLSFRTKSTTPEKETARRVCLDIDAFSHYISDTLQPAFRSGPSHSWQAYFLKARQYYKQIEWAAEYFTYSTARFINGAPKKEAELAGQMIVKPSGLQVMEEHLFPEPDTAAGVLLLQQAGIILDNLQLLKAYFTNIPIASWQILDAVKLEMFRIETLGIAGFDDALSRNSMQECAASMQAMEKALVPYTSQSDSVQTLLNKSVAFLLANKDFNNFDRAAFIRRYASPLTTAIELLRRKLNLPAYQYNRLLRQEAFTLFDSDAFNADAYSPFINQENKAAKIKLGEALFTETAFSGNNKVSCASCHHPENAFAENITRHAAIKGAGSIDRNTPSLINAALQPQLFYDQRAETLEDQLTDVMHNPKEMDGDLDTALKRMGASGKYETLFTLAFPGKANPDSASVTEALAAYVRSLVKLNSRFDEYMCGNNAALTSEEVQGFNLFMGKAQCGTCHYMPLFNGVFPPKFITQDAEVIGVPAKQKGRDIDADRGLFITLLRKHYYDSTRLLEFDHAFKTPTVRNASQTAPYMHNGVYKTLEEVLDFYNNGGGTGEGLQVANQSLSAEKLNLTPEEIKAVIAFMKSLDSRE
ncbi:cytochrome-c peroxidase [Parafilimonas sp.]|uniref:cytochrome-c peroxidase n=1 Tax=Parafilimonas sp. TaxID=1969739 RepID=UPI0039E240B4